MTPYFSVILPIFNVAPYLERCVQSVLEQSFRDFELILVDDGSTDESPALCEELAARDSRIRCIHKPNGGLSSARNAGTEIARGTYIWWVDSDDWIEPEALDILRRESADGPDVVKFCHFRVTDKKEQMPSCVRRGSYGPEEKKALMEMALTAPSRFCLSAWSHIYRRAFLEEHSLCFVSERLVCSEDYRFNLEALLLAEHIRVTEDCLYNYELRPGSLTQTYKPDLFARFTLLYTQLKQRYEDLGAPEALQKKLDGFYIWHLFQHTCISGEYVRFQGHTMAQGRKNVRRYLKDSRLQRVLRHCDRRDMTLRQRLLVLGMVLRWEPLFYWLYVTKPKRKKGSQT